MRKRFRGNQPINLKEVDGGSGSESGYVSGGSGKMLYAGKPAYTPVVKETRGDEKEKPDWREVENERYRKEG